MVYLILLLLLLVSCGKKVEYINKVVYKDRVVEVKPEVIAPPECYLVDKKGFYKVRFVRCSDSYYCLDKVNATKLIINVDNLKLCYQQLKKWSNLICNNNNINCLDKDKK